MGFDDLVNQGKGLYEQNKDKIAEALKSEQAEGVSDKVLHTTAWQGEEDRAGRARREGPTRSARTSTKPSATSSCFGDGPEGDARVGFASVVDLASTGSSRAVHPR